jgi:Nif-specific regulatory protein
MVQSKFAAAERECASHSAVLNSPSEVAIIGIYEISKILTGPNRLDTALATVVNILSSFLQMRHGTIALLADDGIPDITVGTGWNGSSDEHYRSRLPVRVVGQIISTAVPLVVQNVASHPLFAPADAESLGASAKVNVSFIGVPIRAEGRVIGTLTIDRIWNGGSMFRLDSDVRFLTMVANLVGQAVQLHRVVSRDRDRLITESHRLQKTRSDRKSIRERDRMKIEGIIGESPALRMLTGKVAVVAKSNAPVLLRGESGTGKELIAKAIHELSPRAAGPFIKVNCAALTESVLESELFGHEKGAFTGAISAHKGRFELADNGTLFLDEIGEISLSFQAKLLRVLQEQEFERVGGNRTIKVNVRIVAATNRDLEQSVARNEFRSDLYYRISVVPIILPPLRERSGDIPLLAREFLKRFNEENDRALTLSPGAIDVLTGCYFPGNVRELENCVQRTATLAEGQQIIADDFACRQNQCLSAVLWKGRSELPSQRPRPEVLLPILPAANIAKPTPKQPDAAVPATPASAEVAGTTEIVNREHLYEAMERAGWVQAKAARLLGLTPRQIGYALKKHAIAIKQF